MVLNNSNCAYGFCDEEITFENWKVISDTFGTICTDHFYVLSCWTCNALLHCKECASPNNLPVTSHVEFDWITFHGWEYDDARVELYHLTCPDCLHKEIEPCGQDLSWF